jgi:nicotinamide-nucleotide amidase
MKIEIVTTGDEILQGITIDTNSAWIAERCHMLGHEVLYHTSVGDDAKDIGDALRRASERADCVIVSGGLGPTVDDITVEAAAREFKIPLYLDKEILKEIRNFFERVGRKMAAANEKQAMIPKGGKAMPNAVGTAPGIEIKLGKAEFFFLPGVPRELYPMFEGHVMPWLKENVKGSMEMRVLRCFGMPEADIDEVLTGVELFGARLGFRVKYPEILLKLIARSNNAADAKKSVDFAAEKIKERLGDIVYSEGDADMMRVVGRMLREKQLTLAVAESCTGGMLCNIITDIPGSSDYFERGIISYSNRSKQELLGISTETLRAHGAVSRETAMAMAEGIRKASGASIGVAVTGIAGPGGGTPEKPVGTVHIACSAGETTEAFEYRFQGDRLRIKLITSMTALNLVRKYLMRG